MARIITFVLTAGIALVVAAPGLGKGQPVVTDPATEAQILRGEAMDRHYGIGRFAVDPATQAQILRGQALGRYYQGSAIGVDPATEAQIVRGVALDRHFGLGRFVVDPATEAQILRGQALGRHYRLDSSSRSPSDRLEQNVGARGLTDDPASRVGSTIEVSSGSDLDWAQLVAGLGIGVLLGASLLLAMRLTRARPVGH
jgi:hypothetical protein